MSWTCTSGNKTSKARKRHRCAVCTTIIQSGETQITRTGIMSGEGFHTMHMHPECEEYSRDWKNDDWESFCPEMSLAVVKRELASDGRKEAAK